MQDALEIVRFCCKPVQRHRQTAHSAVEADIACLPQGRVFVSWDMQAVIAASVLKATPGKLCQHQEMCKFYTASLKLLASR